MGDTVLVFPVITTVCGWCFEIGLWHNLTYMLIPSENDFLKTMSLPLWINFPVEWRNGDAMKTQIFQTGPSRDVFLACLYTEHFLLLCPSFAVPRRDLLTGVLALLRPYGYVNNSNEALMQVLLYGDKSLPDDLNKSILLLTLNFIHQTGRLD